MRENKILIGSIAILSVLVLVIAAVYFLNAEKKDVYAPNNKSDEIKSSSGGLIYIPGEYEKVSNQASYREPTYNNNSYATVSFEESEDGKRLIYVSGYAKKTSTPDHALIYVSVETLDKSPKMSQQRNAEIVDNVIKKLKEAGIDTKDMQTENYSLHEEYEWDEELKKSVSKGYKTINTIKIKVRDLEKTGEIIDVAVKAGANRVTNIVFDIDEDKKNELKKEALKEAAKTAKSKAEAIASGLGIEVGRVYSVSENYDYYTPIYRSATPLYKSLNAEQSVTTPINPEDVEISASLTIQFEIY